MLKYALNHWYIALWAVSRKLVNKSLDFPASEPLKAGHCCKIKKQLANGTTLTDSELCTWMYERLSLWTNPCVPQNTKHSRPFTPNFIIKRHFWVKIVFTSAPIQGHPRSITAVLATTMLQLFIIFDKIPTMKAFEIARTQTHWLMLNLRVNSRGIARMW